MATYKAEGIIIKRINYSEADKILTVYTRGKGKIIILAKGARKTSSRKGPHLDLFNYNIFFLAEGKNLDIVTEVKPLGSFSVAKKSLSRISVLYYLGELIDKFIGEGQPNLKLFNLLEEMLNYLSTEEVLKAPILLRRFELLFISELGFRPELYYCVRCRKPIQKKGNTFSAASGGIICPKCVNGEGLLISTATLKVLRFFLREPLNKVKRLVLKEPVDLKIKNILRYYIEWLLEKKIKSLDFLEEVSR